MKWKLILPREIGPGAELPITRVPFSIGRSDGCDLVVTDTRVSRRHCQLMLVDDAPYVLDSGSRNGVYVNGERVTGGRALRAGDCLRLGPVVAVIGVSAGSDDEPPPTDDDDVPSAQVVAI